MIGAASTARRCACRGGGPLAGDVATATSRPGCPASRRPAGWRAPTSTSTPTPTATRSWRRSTCCGGRGRPVDGGPLHGRRGDRSLVAANPAPDNKAAEIVPGPGSRSSGSRSSSARSRGSRVLALLQACRPKKVAICPNVGWLPDFPDAASLLAVPFDGARSSRRTTPTGRSSTTRRSTRRWTRPAALDRATQRAEAWAQVDKVVTATRRRSRSSGTSSRTSSPRTSGRDRGGTRLHDLSFTSLKSVEPRRSPRHAAGPLLAAMVRYIIRRMLWVIVLLFARQRAHVPDLLLLPSADPAALRAGRKPTPELVAQIREHPRPRPSRSTCSTGAT